MTLAFHSVPLSAFPALDAGGLASERAVQLDPALRPAFVADGLARERLDLLLSGRAFCVTTGQQPGLFTGPLFTVYKALTAIALAESLEARVKRPVVPVFWVAGDDHDFAEANHVYLLGLDNEIDRVELRGRDANDPLRPLYQEPLGHEVSTVIASLMTHTPDTEFRAEVLAWLERHYRSEHDLATAFAGAVAELLGPLGLVVLRPTHAETKQVMAPHLLSALEHASALDAALADTAQDIEGAGQRAPVHVGDGASLVMIEGRMGRDRLVIDGSRFIARRSGESWNLDQLRAIAETEPMRLSPNVLLRPVVEAAILPTLAYVAGPGELAYLPQCRPVYDRLEVAPQVPVPRWSGTIVEQRVQKVLDKYGITVESFGSGDVEARLAREDMPLEATAALSAITETLQVEYGRLEAAAIEIDPTMRKPVQHARNSALSGVRSIEKRLVAHLKKQNEIVAQQLAKARHNLLPNGQPQERIFTVAPYLIRYGPPFLHEALDRSRRFVGHTEAADLGP
ncbi:MAG: bacillithiol biosynthesis cysteine-adding enzyme BshC [Gemmatimonadota bacterium]|nr:bacillithiol biosynthesis cysteine-adding enzyme BshC [Gemmatimonadota bacterium]